MLLVNSMGNFILGFTTTSINIAIPAIQTEMHLGAVAMGWLPLIYILASAIFLLPLGRVADAWGRRRVFLLGLLLFTICSLAMVFSQSYLPLVGLRAGQGLGVSLFFAGSAAMITLAYPPERRGMAMGLAVAAAYLGQTAGPAIGGVIVFSMGWRGLFIVAAAFGAFLLVLDRFLLRRTDWREKPSGGSDILGALIYAPALAGFLLGLSWLPQENGIVLTAAGVAGLALFVWWENRARFPVIEIGLFKHNRVFALSNMSALISYASVWAMTFLMSLYLQFIKGLNAETAGLVLITGVAVQTTFSPLSGRLSDRIQPRWVASWGMGLCTIGLFLFSLLHRGTSYSYIIAVLCLMGLGYALFSPANQSSIMGSVERQNMGFASASVATMRMVGMAISIGLATMVIAVVVGRHDIMPADYPHLLTAVRITFGILAAICAVGTATSLVRGDLQLLRGAQITEAP
ncbi:MAG: MFS transporter [Actinobacteria bacterium]|nr:MFS transporter [Actinomycetota bacterium]